jgi:uncharacterized membrane protein YfcA
MTNILQPWLLAATSILDWLFGLAVGIALGLTGGGGMLAVPALVVGLGYSLQEAVPVALVSICIAASMGALDGFRQRLVRYKAAIVMAATGIACAPLGIWLAQSLPVELLTYAFAVLLALVSLKMLFQSSIDRSSVVKGENTRKVCRINPDTGRFLWNRNSFAAFSGIGGVSGVCSGMLGVGGGFLIVPSLHQSSDLSIASTVATSLATVALVSGGTAALIFLQGVGITADSAFFILSVVGGMLLARSCSGLLSDLYLHVGFASIATIAAGVMIYQQSQVGGM